MKQSGSIIRRQRRMQRDSVVRSILPELRAVELAAIELAVSELDRKLVEAAKPEKVQPDGKPLSIAVRSDRDWASGEAQRLIRLWNRIMAGTGSVGILAAQ